MDIVLISLVGAITANIISIICYVLAIILAKKHMKWKIPFWIGVAAGIIPMFGTLSLVANQGVPLTGDDIGDWILFAIITVISILLTKRESESSATPIIEESKQVASTATLPQKDTPSSVKVNEKVDVMTDIPNGGWKCSNCGKAHYSYETSCSCGKSIFDSLPTEKKEEAAISTIDEISVEKNMNTEQQKDNTNTDLSPFDAIRKYKELLDEGIITQEEFDAKKKQLLGL